MLCFCEMNQWLADPSSRGIGIIIISAGNNIIMTEKSLVELNKSLHLTTVT